VPSKSPVQCRFPASQLPESSLPLSLRGGGPHNARMARVWIGTSGFSYKEWKGTFYPPDLADRGMLAYYSTQFRSVEIDSTFYRLPTQKTLEGWRVGSPEDFRFTLKATQQITHRERLKVPSGALAFLTAVIPTLGPKLGLLFFQLPPFSRCDVHRLEAFLNALPLGIPYAFEFRHESWFTADVFRLLRERAAALCIHDADEGCSPLVITAPRVYVRLRKAFYSPEAREQWRSRFREWSDSGLEVFAYVKHKDNPDAPRIALEFAKGF
jgi:uncharacterized protein YecE (DUF72 family)